MGERIVKTLFPELVVATIHEDKGGLDGRIGNLTVQVKADQRISQSGNLYHEYWERTHEGQPWRRSPASVDIFYFITEGFWIDLNANDLAILEVGLTMARIKPRGQDTSIGVLIPLSRVATERRHLHDLWIAYEERNGVPPPPLNMTDPSFDEIGSGKPGSVLA